MSAIARSRELVLVRDALMFVLPALLGSCQIAWSVLISRGVAWDGLARLIAAPSRVETVKRKAKQAGLSEVD